MKFLVVILLAIIGALSFMLINTKNTELHFENTPFITHANSNVLITPDLINAIIRVESNGDTNAVGDSGRSVGCMQISKAVVDDVNRFSSKTYTYNDRYNRAKSIEIFKIYINHYATTKRLGHTPTLEDIARIWNGGPNGFKKTATKSYWIKVKNEL